MIQVVSLMASIGRKGLLEDMGLMLRVGRISAILYVAASEGELIWAECKGT